MRPDVVRVVSDHGEMDTADPTRRALALLTLLQARPSWSITELSGRLGTSPRTVRRDVHRLRDLGYGVASRPGPGASYRLEAGARVPPLLFDDEEVLALVAGLRMAQSALGGDAAERALAKLERVLPRRAGATAGTLSTTTEAGLVDLARVDHDIVGVLAAAADAHEAARFTYVDIRGRTSRRRVAPYRQVFSRGHWYLVAYDLDGNDWRTFRLDRIDAVERDPGRADRPALPVDSVAEFFATDFGRAPHPSRS